MAYFKHECHARKARFLRNAASNTDMHFRAICVAFLRSTFSYLRSFSWSYTA